MLNPSKKTWREKEEKKEKAEDKRILGVGLIYDHFLTLLAFEKKQE